jgi:hypothetical protein
LCAASRCGKTSSSKRFTSDKRMLLALAVYTAIRPFYSCGKQGDAG